MLLQSSLCSNGGRTDDDDDDDDDHDDDDDDTAAAAMHWSAESMALDQNTKLDITNSVDHHYNW